MDSLRLTPGLQCIPTCIYLLANKVHTTHTYKREKLYNCDLRNEDKITNSTRTVLAKIQDTSLSL